MKKFLSYYCLLYVNLEVFVPFLPFNWSKQAFLNDIYFYTTIDWYNKGSAFVLLLIVCEGIKVHFF